MSGFSIKNLMAENSAAKDVHNFVEMPPNLAIFQLYGICRIEKDVSKIGRIWVSNPILDSCIRAEFSALTGAVLRWSMLNSKLSSDTFIAGWNEI